MAYGVDLADHGIRGGIAALLWGHRLVVVEGWSASVLRYAVVIEVFESTSGGEWLAGVRGGEAGYGIGRAAGEKAGNKSSDTKGGNFEEAAGGAGRFTGRHEGSPYDEMYSKCRTSMVLRYQRLTLKVLDRNDRLVAAGVRKFG
jgi:hypothetical protein